MIKHFGYFLAAILAGFATQVLAVTVDLNGITITGPTDIALALLGIGLAGLGFTRRARKQ